MSTFRRVVTGHDARGRSIIASDQRISGTVLPGTPGIELTTLWCSDRTMRYPDSGAAPTLAPWFPPIGGFRLAEFIVPPDAAAAAAGADPAATLAETNRRFPGLLDTMDAAHPGMHRSATIDLLYVLSGRVILELDDGSRTELRAGDVAVQSGTMHAWRNPFEEPCRVLGVLIGAELGR